MPNEREQNQEKFFAKVKELIQNKSYCDVTVKMEEGKIVIWTVTTKEKP